MAWIGLYHFDDLAAGTITDVSGNGFDITLAGADAAQVAGGRHGGALGKTGAVMPVLPAGLLAASETDDRTIMFDVLGTGRAVWWFRWESDALGSGIWGVLALDGTTLQSRARRQSDSAAAGALTIGATDEVTWRNVCMTYVRATAVLSVYLGGTLVTSGVPSGWSPGQQLMVGADRINAAEWADTGPAIDNLRIANHAADATEVTALAGTAVTADTEITGSGSLTAPTSTAAGTGSVVVSAAGALTASAGAAAGTAGVAVDGSGTVSAPSALLAGAGTVLGAGQGALVAAQATAVGTGQVLITGTGALVAPAAVVSGSDEAPTEASPSRMFTVAAESRMHTVPAESRIWEA